LERVLPKIRRENGTAKGFGAGAAGQKTTGGKGIRIGGDSRHVTGVGNTISLPEGKTAQKRLQKPLLTKEEKAAHRKAVQAAYKRKQRDKGIAERGVMKREMAEFRKEVGAPKRIRKKADGKGLRKVKVVKGAPAKGSGKEEGKDRKGKC